MELANVVLKYGIEVAVMALVTILLVGIVKVIFKNQFAKLAKGNAKPIYEVLVMFFVDVVVAIWTVIKVYALKWSEFNYEEALVNLSLTYAAVKVLYPLYENFKIRDLLQLIGRAILSSANKHKSNNATSTAVTTSKKNNDGTWLQ